MDAKKIKKSMNTKDNRVKVVITQNYIQDNGILVQVFIDGQQISIVKLNPKDGMCEQSIMHPTTYDTIVEKVN